VVGSTPESLITAYVTTQPLHWFKDGIIGRPARPSYAALTTDEDAAPILDIAKRHGSAALSLALDSWAA